MFIWLIYASCVSALDCYQYSCKAAAEYFAPGDCLKSENILGYNSISVLLCQDQYLSYCPPVNTNASCQLPPQQPIINIATAGEPCTIDQNCLDSKCINSTCVGFSANTPCQRDTQCDVGLYCNSVCTAQRAGSCTSDEMCPNDMACQSEVCTKYFTVPELTVINSCTDDQNFLCTSGACRIIKNNPMCLPSNTSEQSLPIQCVLDSDCTVDLGQNNGGNYSTYCGCSENGFGTSNCGLAPGDKIYLNYTNALGLWFNSSQVAKCHTTRRSNLNCIKSYWDYENYTKLAYFQMYALEYPRFWYSDDCVKQVYQSDFWILYKQYMNLFTKESSKGLVLIVGLWALIIS